MDEAETEGTQPRLHGEAEEPAWQGETAVPHRQQAAEHQTVGAHQRGERQQKEVRLRFVSDLKRRRPMCVCSGFLIFVVAF